MLWQQIGELKGKVTGQRVLDGDEPTTETSVSFSGSFLTMPFNADLMIVDRPAAAGVFRAKGQRLIAAGELELAIWKVKAIGRISTSGVKYCGSHFYNTSSTGKLASLNNAVGVFEAETDVSTNNLRIWSNHTRED